MIPLFFLHALFGSSIPINKFLLSLTSPIWLVGLRMTIAGFLLFIYNKIKKTHFIFKREHFFFYFQIMFFGVYLKYILRNVGLNYMSSAKMSFLLNITPFFAAFFSYMLCKETLTPRQWVGLVIGFVGILPLLLISSSVGHIVGEFSIISWPDILILGAVASHAYSIIVMRTLVRENNYSAAMTNSIRMLGGGLLALITAYVCEGTIAIQQPYLFAGWFSVLIVVSNIICHNFYIHLLKYYSATFMAFTDFLSPIFTALYGWLFFHEVITWHYYFSGIFVLCGLALFYYEELLKENTLVSKQGTIFSNLLKNYL